MVTITDIINDANKSFLQSTSTEELRRNQKALLGVIKDKYINEENKENGTALSYRLCTKLLFLECMDRDFSQNALEDFVSKIEKLLIEVQKYDYAKTIQVMKSSIVVAKNIQKFLVGIEEAKSKIVDFRGNLIAQEVDECTAFEKIVDRKLLAIEDENFENPFAIYQNTVFPNIKEKVLEILNYYKDLAKGAKFRFLDEKYLKILKTVVEVISVDKMLPYKYYPQIYDKKVFQPKMRVICSPFKDEFELFVFAYCRMYKRNLVKIDVSKFLGVKDTHEMLDYIIDKIKDYSDCYYEVVGLNTFKSKNSIYLKRKLALLINDSKMVFIHDSVGDKEVYKEFCKLVGDGEIQQPLYEFSYDFLSMPAYEDTLKILKEYNLVNNIDDEKFLKTRCQLMGFLGLSKIEQCLVIKKDWKVVLGDLSYSRISLAKKYCCNLASLTQLLDEGWEDIEELSNSVTSVNLDLKKIDYDSDELKDYDRKIVDTILYSDKFSLIEKCGLISRYCLLLSNDESFWNGLEKEEKIHRITNATKLVAMLLNTEHIPEVQVKDSLGDTLAGGYCASGGALIVYGPSSFKNVTWLMMCICHEVFHSFQHTAIHFGYQNWHLTELNVTASRIKKWDENSKNYIDIDENENAYRQQVMEADARIFEEETASGASGKWSQLEV